MVSKAFYALNDYFFGVEPDEPIDWMSCILFYGFLAMCLFGSVALMFL